MLKKFKERISIIKKQSLALFLVFVAMLLFLAFDSKLLAFVDLIKFPALNLFFSALLWLQTEPYFELWIVAFMFFLLIKKQNKKEFLKFILAFIIAALINLALKNIISRPRPVPLEGNKSFPSGHSTLIFTTWPFIKNKTIKIVWLIFSILLVFTRVYFKIHFFSDVAAAFILGYGIALLIKKLEFKNKKKTH